MKGKRKEAVQVNKNGEVRGVPGMGEKNHLISWIWLSAGSSGGVVEQEMHDCVRVEWCKVYTRAGVWDRRATAAHYGGKIVSQPVHLQGAMALAAKQAAVRRKLAVRFRRLWRPLTDRISGSDEAASSQSSGVDEDGIASGEEDTEDEYGHEPASEEEPAAGGAGGVADGDREGDGDVGEEDEEGSADRAADTDTRRAKMDELLAMHAPLEEF
ncbi:hypothetical protein B0H14DRAFT_2633688 [Mycena olivaceomarginata]|nr:hypothetical protein B0H14DRAFT_2633688 [Mycena olivaceomarginata]